MRPRPRIPTCLLCLLLLAASASAAEQFLTTTFGNHPRCVHRGALTTNADVIRFHDMAFKDALNGIAVTGVGSAHLFTDDGGRTWSTRANPGPNHAFFGVAYRGSVVVLVGTLHEIHRSTNDGATWTPEREQYSGGETLWAVDMASGTVGAAVGDGGVILRRE